MALQLTPLSDVMGVEATGIDLSQPLSEEMFAEIHDAYLKHILVLFRGQHMTLQQQKEFCALFGGLEIHTNPKNTHADHPEILVLSNVMKDGERIGAPPDDEGAWHSDYAYLKAPCSASFFYAEVVPAEDGDTMFANMYAAYDALPQEMKDRIDDLKWRTHKEKTERLRLSWPPRTADGKAVYPDVSHPLVRTHPETGRKALFLCMRHVELTTIVDMEEAEGQALLQALRDFATKPPFVYSQNWQAGDALVWDNRCSLHRATYWDQTKYQRLIYRTFAKGDVPY